MPSSIFADSTADIYAFDRASVDQITEKDSTRDGTIAGAIIGAIPGLIGGLILNKICYNEIGSCPGAAIGLTALGAGVGAGIGFVADNGRQKLIYDRKLAFGRIRLSSSARRCAGAECQVP